MRPNPLLNLLGAITPFPSSLPGREEFTSFPPSKPAPGHVNSLIWDYRDYRLPHPKGDQGHTWGLSAYRERNQGSSVLPRGQKECWVEAPSEPPLPLPPASDRRQHGEAFSPPCQRKGGYSGISPTPSLSVRGGLPKPRLSQCQKGDGGTCGPAFCRAPPQAPGIGEAISEGTRPCCLTV